MRRQGENRRRNTTGGDSYVSGSTAYHPTASRYLRRRHDEDEAGEELDEGAPLDIPRHFVGHQPYGGSQDYPRPEVEDTDGGVPAYHYQGAPEGPPYNSSGSSGRPLARRQYGSATVHQSPTQSSPFVAYGAPFDQPDDDNRSQYSQGTTVVAKSRTRYGPSARYNNDRESYPERDRDRDGHRDTRPPREYHPSYPPERRPSGYTQRYINQEDDLEPSREPYRNPFAPIHSSPGGSSTRGQQLQTNNVSNGRPGAPPPRRQTQERRGERRGERTEEQRPGSRRHLAPPPDPYAGDESDDPAQVWPRVEVRGITERYTEVSSLVDTGNMTGYNLISIATVRDLGYDDRYIDKRQTQSFRTVGGYAETLGSISLKCRIRLDRDEDDNFLRDEFQVFNDSLPHDMIFAGDSNSGPRAPNQKMLMMVLLGKKKRDEGLLGTHANGL